MMQPINNRRTGQKQHNGMGQPSKCVRASDERDYRALKPRGMMRKREIDDPVCPAKPKTRPTKTEPDQPRIVARDLKTLRGKMPSCKTDALYAIT
jgi:hypothetical protein